MIAGGDVPFDRIPPLWVPLRGFLVAPFIGMAAGVTLLISGGDSLSSRWTGSLLATVHLITLGFLTLVMVAAIVQVLPVVTGVSVPGARWVAPVAQLGIVFGTLAMAWGLIGERSGSSGLGGTLLGIGLAPFVISAAVAAWRARSTPTGQAIGLAVLSLFALAALGVLLLAGHAGWVTLRRDLTDIHLAWALGGWVGLLIVGVAFQVVPMFQVTPPYPKLVQSLLPGVGFVGLLAWTAGRLWDVQLLATSGAFVLASALGLFAVVTLSLQARRRRKIRDVTTDAWRLGMVCLAVAAVITLGAGAGLVDLTTGRVPMAFGVLLVFGFAVSVMEGMLYKIVPFLSWLHLQNLISQRGGDGLEQIRNTRQLLPVKGPRRQFVVHGTALGALLTAVAGGGWWVTGAGVLVALDFGWLGMELVGVVRRHQEDRRSVEGLGSLS